MSNTIAIIDGDLLAFKSAAANEARSIKALHVPSGRSKTFKHRTELKEFIGEKFPLTDFEITDIQDCDDISYALQIVKTMIKGICKTCNADSYEIYLSGKNNFRDKLPLPTKYKGNREGLMVPKQLREVKEYLIEKQKAVVVQGEADDRISIRQYEGLQSGDKVIGCSTDKDSLGTDGWIYNWDTMQKPFLVKGLGKLWIDDKKKVRGYGLKWKMLQWIVGDTIDGLNPCYLAKIKFGEKSGYKLLADLETEDMCYKAVHDLYLSWYPDKIQYKDQTGKEIVADYIDIAQVYWDGVHMQRWENDFVNIRKLFKNKELFNNRSGT